MAGYRIIPHTADAGIEAWGKDLAELFSNAACGLFDVAVQLSTIQPAEPEEITLQADDVSLLLRSWLAELLYRFSGGGRVYCKFGFEALSETSLRATVRGEPFDQGRHRFKTDIKAVTYHQLEVKHTPQGWFARVILDL